MPGHVELIIHPLTATEVISRWKGDNKHAQFDAYSHSLEVTFNCPMFSLWLFAVMGDPSFFAMHITDLSPPDHSVRADCYASPLVARRIGLDIIGNCVLQLAKLLAGAVKNRQSWTSQPTVVSPPSTIRLTGRHLYRILLPSQTWRAISPPLLR